MKKKEKAKWLREVASWLRAMAGAPGALLVIVWGLNGVGAMLGKPVAFDVLADPANVELPAAVASGVLFVVFNTLATRLEIKADELEEESERFVLKARRRKSTRRGGSG